MFNRIQLPDVVTFDRLKSDKPLAIKVLEEAAELSVSVSTFVKSKAFSGQTPENLRTNVLDEIADVCQALGNLVVELEFSENDLNEAMSRCEQRNIDRGRITK